MAHVFVSYVHENEEQVDQLCEELARYGIQVRRGRDTAVGVDWQQAIRRAIRGGAFFIACFSKEYTERDSTYMNEELTLAIDELRQRPTDIAWFIPVMLNECEIPDWNIGAGRTLRSIQWVKLYEDWDYGVQRILEAIQPVIRPTQYTRAYQHVEALADQGVQTGGLLSAETLRILYLNRDKYSNPPVPHRKVLFRNLLTQGKGKAHKQRLTNPDTPTGGSQPAPLGWFWFSNISKMEFLERTREEIDYPNFFVRAGVARALGLLNSSSDESLLRKLMDGRNARVVSEAIRAIARMGLVNNVQAIRSLHTDRRAEVRGAVAYALAQLGSEQDFQIMLDLREDKNSNVRRDALEGLVDLYNRIPSVKDRVICEIEKVLNNPNEQGQVTSVARKAKKQLNGIPVDPINSYDRSVENMALRCGLEEKYDEESANTAYGLLFHDKYSYAQEASIRWLVKYEAHESIEELIKEKGEELHFVVLQRFDYYLYCPKWWQDAIESDCG